VEQPLPVSVVRLGYIGYRYRMPDCNFLDIYIIYFSYLLQCPSPLLVIEWVSVQDNILLVTKEISDQMHLVHNLHKIGSYIGVAKQEGRLKGRQLFIEGCIWLQNVSVLRKTG
jgi:hypothetical protein